MKFCRFCQKIQLYDVIVTSDYVIREIKLCSEVLNDEYIILSNFGGRRMSAFEAIEGGFEDPPVAGSKKKA